MDEHLDLWMEDRLSGNCGDILDLLNAEDEFADEYPAEPWDEMLAQRELEDFEQANEFFGCFGDEDW